MTAKIGILISGRGTNMAALAQHAEEDKNVEISFVASDNPKAVGLKLAQNMGLKTFNLPYSQGRAVGEAAIEKLWNVYNIDLLVLAGFMKLMTPAFVDHHADRILNIHPALLPKFPGTHGIQDFWMSGELYSGVTVHIVDAQMDHGPILFQMRVERKHSDTLSSFEARIHETEHKLYWPALKSYIQRLGLEKNL